MRNRRDDEVLIAQLVAARAQIDATLAVLCAGECEHPKEAIENMTVMGGEEKYRCTACGAESAQPFSNED